MYTEQIDINEIDHCSLQLWVLYIWLGYMVLEIPVTFYKLQDGFQMYPNRPIHLHKQGMGGK